MLTNMEERAGLMSFYAKREVLHDGPSTGPLDLSKRSVLVDVFNRRDGYAKETSFCVHHRR